MCTYYLLCARAFVRFSPFYSFLLPLPRIAPCVRSLPFQSPIFSSPQDFRGFTAQSWERESARGWRKSIFGTDSHGTCIGAHTSIIIAGGSQINYRSLSSPLAKDFLSRYSPGLFLIPYLVCLSLRRAGGEGIGELP